MTYVDSMQHATVTINAQTSLERPHPVIHPPDIGSTRHRSVVSPVDWEGVAKNLDRR